MGREWNKLFLQTVALRVLAKRGSRGIQSNRDFVLHYHTYINNPCFPPQHIYLPVNSGVCPSVMPISCTPLNVTVWCTMFPPLNVTIWCTMFPPLNVTVWCTMLSPVVVWAPLHSLETSTQLWGGHLQDILTLVILS